MKNHNLGEFEQLVLFAILHHPNNAYGVNIWREIEARTGRSVLVGAVYTTLDRLEKKGLITSCLGESTAERGGRAKRYYRIEESGLAAIKHATRAFKSMMAGLTLEDA